MFNISNISVSGAAKVVLEEAIDTLIDDDDVEAGEELLENAAEMFENAGDDANAEDCRAFIRK